MVFSFNSGSKLIWLSVTSFSTTTNRVQSFKILTPLFRTLLTSHDSIRRGVINVLLRGISDLPKTFIDGRDCSMVRKISGMLKVSLQRLEKEHCSLYVTVYRDSCRYNVKLGDDEGDALTSEESVRSMAEGEGSKLSYPAGATAIERDGGVLGKRKREEEEEEEEKCSICFEGFDCENHEVGRLPCSHGFHTKCVLEWFVRGSATCPICRFPCTH